MIACKGLEAGYAVGGGCLDLTQEASRVRRKDDNSWFHPDATSYSDKGKDWTQGRMELITYRDLKTTWGF